MFQWTDEKKQTVRDMAILGLSTYAIEERSGVPRHYVRLFIADDAAAIAAERERPALAPEIASTIIDLELEGQSHAEIAGKTGCTEGEVRRVILKDDLEDDFDPAANEAATVAHLAALKQQHPGREGEVDAAAATEFGPLTDKRLPLRGRTIPAYQL